MPEPRKGKSYDIRIQRAVSTWMGEKRYGWGYDGQLPAEWEQVKADPTVEQAVIFLGTQRRRRSDRRKLSDQYRREA
ncbi:MAG TPA: hypothetical protein VKR06_02415 [Ktedonosporobacter sp.]|nr:hypothetical protein [Ktedonosporobacter sp.]